MSTTSIASARTGEEYFNSGVRTARRAAGFGGLEQLYDHHYAAFGYPADQLKGATIGALRDRVSWQSSLDALMRAVEINPREVEWQRWTALVLEELGRFDDALLVRRTIASIDPDSLENNFALGRLLERKGEPVHDYYARVLKSGSDYLLALARGVALSGPPVTEPDSLENDFALGRMLECKGEPLHEPGLRVLAGESDYLRMLAQCDPWCLLFAQARLRDPSQHTTQRLRDRIRRALTLSPTDVALHLAMGFVGIAERDDVTTRTSFLTALVLAEQPEPKKGCDPWSLVFAQAFLLDHSDIATSGLILPSDPIRLALARAAALRSHGAIMPALREYGAAISQLLIQKLPRAYRIYNGYKVVFFKNQFYGVPKDVRDFSILRGRVVSIPDANEGSASRMVRSRFAALLSEWQRARLKYLLRIARPHIQSIVETLLTIRALRHALRVVIRVLRHAVRLAVRALRLATKKLRRLAGDIYLKMHIVGGVLIESDADQLQQRIDTPKQASPDATASARPSATG